MDKLLKLAQKQADQAEILVYEDQCSSLVYENYDLKHVPTRNSTEVSLRVIKEGKLGFSCGTSFDNRQWIVSKAIESAINGPTVEFSFPADPSPPKDFVDPTLYDLGLEDMAVYGAKIVDRMREKGQGIPMLLYLENNLRKVTIANTSGKNESYRKTLLSVKLYSIFKGSKEGVEKEMVRSCYFDFPPELVDELIKEYRFSEIQCRVPIGRMKVLFRSSATWSLLYRLQVGVSGDSYIRGITPLIDRLGEQIFSSKLFISDDPLLPGGAASCPFDDEGVPCRKKIIINSGVLNNYIFDLYTGARSGFGSTGNGFKRSMWTEGIEQSPNPRFSNLIVEPGTDKLEDMIKSIDRGVIVNNVIGFHSANLMAGEFSMNVGVGFYVEKGKILGRAMDTMVAGNIYEDFKHIAALGDKVEYGPLICYTPDILFDNLSVIGKQ